jgi:hypothetical protein
MFSRAWFIDTAERTAWTGAEAGLGYLSAVVADLPTQWAIPFAGALAILKGIAAKHIGSSDSAATLTTRRDADLDQALRPPA